MTSPTTTSWLESADPETERVDGEQIYCLTCGAEKLKTLCMGDKPYTFKVNCPCDDVRQQAESARAETEHKNWLRKENILRLKTSCGLGKRYENATFSNTAKEQDPAFIAAMNECVRYCTNADEALRSGKGLYLYGVCGIGKTWLAACVCNELTDMEYSVTFTSFCEISRLIRETYNTNRSENEVIKPLIAVDFLIIDDIGTEIVQKNNGDNWLQERIYDIINSRYTAVKPMIYTSNYAITQLVSARGLMPKTADRIFETSSAVIAVKNRNWRYE